MKKTVTILLAILMSACLVGCGEKSAPNLFLFSYTELELTGEGRAKAEREITDFLKDFERAVAVDIPGSDIDRVNRAAAGEAVAVGEDTMKLLQTAKRVYEDTSGAFNPALYPVSELWGFTPAFEGRYWDPRPEPPSEALEKLAPYCDFSTVELSGGAVTKRYAETRLDLGGIAKGYAADRAAEIARRYGCKGSINVGGNLYTLNRGYLAGIRDPRYLDWEEYNEIFGVIKVSETSVAVSGDYERFYRYEGKRYCHIIDPGTLKPVDTGVVSVSVIHPVSCEADAYATAAFALGHEAAANLFEERKLASVIIFFQNGVYYYRTTCGVSFETNAAGWEVYKEYRLWNGGQS